MGAAMRKNSTRRVIEYGWRVWFAIGLFWLVAGCAASAKPAAEEPIPLVVWDLEDLRPMGHGQMEIGEVLSGQLAAHLSQNPGFQMVERQHLLKAIEELHLASSELADPDTRLRLGRIIGARQMVFGAFQVIGPSLRLDLRRVDVTSGRIIKTASATAVTADLESWLSSIEKAANVLMAP